jgi:sugar phosphate isomerase/epimerase
MFSFSTAWNADRLLDGEEIVREIVELGLQQIELNFSLTSEMVEAACRFVRIHHLAISSLHNYCPIPQGLTREEALPDCYSLSAIDEDERRRAVACTKITIDTAVRVSARAVVLHTGRVEMPDRTRQLIGLAVQGQKETPAYRAIFDAFVAERSLLKRPYVDQILRSLEELEGYARPKKILLGVENRFYFREIPLVDEYKEIFARFGQDTSIGYWHDVGHATVFERLGLLKPDELLENFGDRLIGMHLHDVKDLVDHQAPFEGDVDFARLKKYIRPDTIKVLEIHRQASAATVKKSVARLSEVLS